MARRNLLILVYFIVGIAIATAAYIQDVYPIERAIGFLSRAQSAGYSDDMARYAAEALLLIPREGNPVWLFPTIRTDFSLTRNVISSIIDRLRSISNVPHESAAYAQTLNDLRGKIAVLTNQLYEAMPYVIFKPINIVAALAYLISPFIVRKIINSAKRKK